MTATAVESRPDTLREFFKDYTTTGPGTRGGEMLRRYWHPVCLSSDLKDIPYPVRMLSEDLVAFRSKDGKAGLVGHRCPHRGASLEYGQIAEHGIQCSYHGWTFDSRGQCIDMPLARSERADSRVQQNLCHLWYPTEEWSGIVWCYMGKDRESPPPLPKIDLLTRTDGQLTVARGIVFDRGDSLEVVTPNDVRKYNYLAFLENFVDLGHLYALHMVAPPPLSEELRPHVDLTVDTCWQNAQHSVVETSYGLKAVVVHKTSNPDRNFMNTFSIAMPSYYRFSGLGSRSSDFTDDRRESGGVLRIIDDTQFEIIRFWLTRKGNYRQQFAVRTDSEHEKASEGLRGSVPKKEYDHRKYPAWEGNLVLEDLVIQESQGVIPNRLEEHLVSSDVGVALLRRIWRQSMENVANGKPPKEVAMDNSGIFEVDTFKGFVKPSEVQIGPHNMPSSRDGGGLIRDVQGNLVF